MVVTKGISLIEHFIPAKSRTNTPVKVDIEKNKATIYWKNKGGGRHPKPITVPRTINVNDETIALMGFFLGDGLKSNKGAASRTLAFTNSEPKTVKWAMRLFRLFNIQKDKIKASVSVIGNNINQEEVKDYWSRITGVPKENMSVNIRPSLSRGKRNLPAIKKYGAIKIEFYSAILRDIALRLLNFAILKSRRNSKSAKAFLKV